MFSFFLLLPPHPTPEPLGRPSVRVRFHLPRRLVFTRTTLTSVPGGARAHAHLSAASKCTTSSDNNINNNNYSSNSVNGGKDNKQLNNIGVTIIISTGLIAVFNRNYCVIVAVVVTLCVSTSHKRTRSHRYYFDVGRNVCCSFCCPPSFDTRDIGSARGLDSRPLSDQRLIGALVSASTVIVTVVSNANQTITHNNIKCW